MFLSCEIYEKIFMCTLIPSFCASAKILFPNFVRGVVRESGLVALAQSKATIAKMCHPLKTASA